MKIENNRINKEVSFKDVFIGDCFIYEEECYIKVDEYSSPINAFNLERNETDTFSADVIVIPVNAKVVIE